MQLREVPVTPVPENSNELDEEAEWIYRQAFCKPTVSTQVFTFEIDLIIILELLIEDLDMLAFLLSVETEIFSKTID